MKTSILISELDVTHFVRQTTNGPDSNRPQSSRPVGPSQSLLGTIREGNINIDCHASIPTPALESLHRQSLMSRTFDEFVDSLLRDSPEASNVATGSGKPSPNMDDSQGPLDVMPLQSIMGPPANVPPTRSQQVTQTETSKSKRSNDPPTLDQVIAKTVPGLIPEVQLCAIRNHYDFFDGVKTRISDEGENIDTPTMKVEASEEGGIGEDVRAYWSMANSTLHAENSAKTQGEIDKFRAGFPEALPHEVFCDRDVLIKAGLTKGADNFPKFTLLALFSRKHASGNCTMPHKVAYKSKRKGSSIPEFSTTTKKAKKAPKSPRPYHYCDPGPVFPLLGKSDSSSLPPPKSGSGSDGPWLPTPYTLPSGVMVTEDAISKVKSSITSLLMKTCMLRKDVEGIMTCASPEELHDSFFHFQLKATKCAYGLSLKWKEAESSLAKLADEKSLLEERLNEALSRADNAESKYQDLLAVCDGLIHSKTDLSNRYEADVAALKRSLEESQQTSWDLKAHLDSSQLLLAGIEKRLEELSSRPSIEAVVEAFKKSDTYRDLLIDNTVPIMKEFSSEVYPEFRGIHSLFPEFAEKTFGQEYVVELTDSEEEDTESTDLGDDNAFSEDAPPEDAPVA
ncbi:hypothetical protein LIER_00229 [Lithospermum erythrorhizon]|uniref:Uncharacterized protein n=1 Tax=Lithospermum erythrorhizon TaxID=34254 RepID=A0AAV3NGR1_LITER